MPKQPRSFSIDEDVAEILSDRDDVNPSAAVNKFLREYLTSGRGAEAALEVRLSQLDEEIAEKEKELERLRRERGRIDDRLRQNKSELTEQVNEIANKINQGDFPVKNIDPENPAIQNWASEAGVPAERFVDELQAKVMTDGGTDR
jgi:predicted  nucleic acid-binding Zn-ribbon protein